MVLQASADQNFTTGQQNNLPLESQNKTKPKSKPKGTTKNAAGALKPKNTVNPTSKPVNSETRPATAKKTTSAKPSIKKANPTAKTQGG